MPLSPPTPFFYDPSLWNHPVRKTSLICLDPAERERRLYLNARLFFQVLVLWSTVSRSLGGFHSGKPQLAREQRLLGGQRARPRGLGERWQVAMHQLIMIRSVDAAECGIHSIHVVLI